MMLNQARDTDRARVSMLHDDMKEGGASLTIRTFFFLIVSCQNGNAVGSNMSGGLGASATVAVLECCMWGYKGSSGLR